MKILIFGFKPYKGWRSNVSEQVIKNLPPGKNLIKAVFPVKFDKKMFIDKIEKHKPDVIIGLGQHDRARKIRIERKGVRRGKNPKEHFVSLKLKKDKNSTIAYDAGRYVCNFSIFTIMDYIKENKKNIRFAFLHIPRKIDPSEAAESVEKIILRVRIAE